MSYLEHPEITVLKMDNQPESLRSSFVIEGSNEGKGIWRMAFSPQGTFLAASSVNKLLIVDAKNIDSPEGIKKPRQVIDLEGGDYIHAIAFSPDEKHLAVSDDEGLITFFHLDQEEKYFVQQNENISLPTHPNADVTKLHMIDNDQMIIAEQKGICLWQLQNGHWAQQQILSEDHRAIFAVSADQKIWVIENADYEVRIFERQADHSYAQWRYVDLYRSSLSGSICSLAVNAHNNLIMVGYSHPSIFFFQLTEPELNHNKMLDSKSIAWLSTLNTGPINFVGFFPGGNLALMVSGCRALFASKQ